MASMANYLGLGMASKSNKEIQEQYIQMSHFMLNWSLNFQSSEIKNYKALEGHS